jgi:hypothetical protein
MTYTLSHEQSARWKEGAESAWRIEQAVLEDVQKRQLDETIVVVLDDGLVAFWVSDTGVLI